MIFVMQEQLRHKAKFNMIAFNSKVVGWRDRLVEVTERSLKSAWNWVQGLTCWGSTNTYTAIQTALSDAHAQAIYLLSDGRPDQVSDGFPQSPSFLGRCLVNLFHLPFQAVNSLPFLC